MSLEKLKSQLDRELLSDLEKGAELLGYVLVKKDEVPAGTLAKLERMREALKPFAMVSEAYAEHSGAWLPSHFIYMFNGVGVTLGDIREARAALEDTK